MAKEKVSACPCDSGKAFADCCGPCLDGRKAPDTAEALMRSRYAAYALGNEAYVRSTWHDSTCPASLDLAVRPAPKWIGLKVLRHEPQDDSHAIVEFVARYKVNGRACEMRETSRFIKENGRWFYVDGDTEADAP